ncbi:hypothetical protein MIR68_006595 [Amoeboaphelidium protococcarum]|nr:hypothetical protein MIR68_006595 [Amoeboaphelidium protococcarum]
MQNLDLQTLKKRAKYYVPIFSWLPKYDVRQNLSRDFFAGLTVSLLIIPQSLSYSLSLCHLPAVYGLYTSFIAMLVYGLFGMSRQLSVGPEALICLLIGNAIQSNTVLPVPPVGNSSLSLNTSQSLSSPYSLLSMGTASRNSLDSGILQQQIEIATTLALLVGVFTLALGLARLGFLDSVLSQSLLRGFITAVALVIFIEQMPVLFGLPQPLLPDGHPQHGDEAESPFQKFSLILGHLHQSNWRSILMSILSLGFLFGVKTLKSYAQHSKSVQLEPGSDEELLSWRDIFSSNRHQYQRLDQQGNIIHGRKLSAIWNKVKNWIVLLPEILILILVTSLITYSLHLHDIVSNVAILGDSALQTGFKGSVWPKLTLNRVKALLTPAILISVLGFVEATVVSKQFAQKYHYTVSPNRELVAFGVMNIIGSLLNAFPAYASMARSHLADSAHAKTQLYSILGGLLVMLTILFILPVFYYVPLSVMGSIVCYAASGLLEFEDLVFWIKIGAWWPDIGMMILSALTTIFVGVEAGILGSIAVSLILVVKESTRVKMSVLVKVPAASLDGQFDGDNDQLSQYQPPLPIDGQPQHQTQNYSMPSSQASPVLQKFQSSMPVSSNVSPNTDMTSSRHKAGKFKYKPLEEVYSAAGQSLGMTGSLIGGRSSGANQLQPAAQQHLEDILIVRIEERLTFANTGQLMDRLRRAEAYGGWLHTHPSEESKRDQTRQGLQSVVQHSDSSLSLRGRRRNGSEGSAQSQTEGANFPLRRSRRKTRHQLINVTLDGSRYESMSHQDVDTDSVFSKDSADLDEHNHVQNDRDIDDELQAAQQLSPQYLKAIIFDIENMPDIDASALLTLTHIVQSFVDRDIAVCFVKMRENVKRKFIVCGLIGDVLRSDCFFRKIKDAEDYLRSKWSQEESFDNPSNAQSYEDEDDILNINQGYSTYDVL